MRGHMGGGVCPAAYARQARGVFCHYGSGGFLLIPGSLQLLGGKQAGLKINVCTSTYSPLMPTVRLVRMVFSHQPLIIHHSVTAHRANICVSQDTSHMHKPL